MLSVRVLTWNLDGLNTRRLDARAEEACVEMMLGQSLREAVAGGRSKPPPQIIALQEVVRRIHLATLRPHFEAAGYALFPREPSREDGDYSVIAARAPWAITRGREGPFEHSPLGRRWVEAHLRREDGVALRVITGHMESLRSGRDARLAQAAELDRRLGDPDAPPTVFMGDTNLRDTEWREVQPDLAFDDAFALAGSPRAHSATWWPPDDPAARGFRFDRIWLDPGHRWEVLELSTRRRPRISDHAALQATLRVA